MSVLILEKLNLTVNESQQVIIIQIKRKLLTSRVLESNHSQDVLMRLLFFFFLIFFLIFLWKVVAFKEVYHHPSVAHEIDALSLHEPELFLRDVIVEEGGRRSSHI